MTPILAIVLLWLALDVVLVAGWHAAHVVARRSATTNGHGTPGPGVAVQTSYRFDRERAWSEGRSPVGAAGTMRS